MRDKNPRQVPKGKVRLTVNDTLATHGRSGGRTVKYGKYIVRVFRHLRVDLLYASIVVRTCGRLKEHSWFHGRALLTPTDTHPPGRVQTAVT